MFQPDKVLQNKFGAIKILSISIQAVVGYLKNELKQWYFPITFVLYYHRA